LVSAQGDTSVTAPEEIPLKVKSTTNELNRAHDMKNRLDQYKYEQDVQKQQDK
jgi:hypothetical protein